MGLTKTEIYTPEQIAIAQYAKAIGHPARVAIIQHLLKVDQCVCGDIVEEIGLSQATISQHLKELKNINLIKGSISGTSICYCIDPIRYAEIEHVLSTFFGHQFTQKTYNCSNKPISNE